MAMQKVSRYRININDRYDKTIYPDWVAHPIRNGRLIEEQHANIDSFTRNTYIDHGFTSTVSLVKHKLTGKYYAIKGIRKKFMFQSKSYTQIRRQCDILIGLSNRFIAHCFLVFDHHSFVYLAQEYCVGATLWHLLEREKSIFGNSWIGDQAAKFYVAEVASALDYLHKRRIIYRNLCPENVGISWHGHVKLIGFGNAIELDANVEELETFNTCVVGNILAHAPELLSPDIMRAATGDVTVQKRFHSFHVDWWALGALAYRLVIGKYPFGHDVKENKTVVARRIIRSRYTRSYRFKIYSKWNKGNGFIVMINGLCDYDVLMRWGFQQLKECKWMKDIAIWTSLHKIVPPFTPRWYLTHGDTTCFAKTQKQHKRKMKIGVLPDEIQDPLTESEMSYCYFRKQCEEVMNQARFLSAERMKPDL